VISLLSLNFSAFEDGETFGRATIGFYLRHLQHSSFCGEQRASDRTQTILNFFLYRIFWKETNIFLHGEIIRNRVGQAFQPAERSNPGHGRLESLPHNSLPEQAQLAQADWPAVFPGRRISHESCL
jgi:hypothetical protein